MLSEEERKFYDFRGAARFLIWLVALVVVLLVLAAGAAVLWVALASPPQWQVTQQGVVLTEEASGAQVGVELVCDQRVPGLPVLLHLPFRGKVVLDLGRYTMRLHAELQVPSGFERVVHPQWIRVALTHSELI